MGLEPRNPDEITFIVITIRHYAPRSAGVGGHTSAEIFTLLESLFSIISVSIFVSLSHFKSISFDRGSRNSLPYMRI